MELSLTTPALLFPAISLLLLAYTNRFLAIANAIRTLHSKYLENPEEKVLVGQIKNLRVRLHLIRNMQIFGVTSFFCCVLSMILIFQKVGHWGSYTFAASMFFLLISLLISLREIQISTKALELELSDMEFGSKIKF
jgi:hypothetical protein